MASSLRVPVLLLAVLVLSLAMTPMALKSVKKWLRLMGELEEGNVSDEEVQYVVDFAIQEYNRANAEPNLYRVARIVRVQQQVRGHWPTRVACEARSICTCRFPPSAPCPHPAQCPSGWAASSAAHDPVQGSHQDGHSCGPWGSLVGLGWCNPDSHHEAWPRP